jgi:phage terminase large subunit-like protein
MSVPFTPTPNHPVMPLPTAEQAAEMGLENWIAAMKQREETIAKERADPLRHGWEPPIWKVCDALIGFPRPEPDWAETAEKIRARLKFRRLIKILLILGGNRSGKSEYVAKRTVQLVSWNKKKRVWMFHQSAQMSVEYQQPLIWKYMPPELRKVIRTAVTYISFTLKNGFSEGRVVMPSESDISFRNYEQERATIEGGEIDLAAPDELIPPDWLETLELRIATRGGAVVVTFTPVEGYSETVAMLCDGATPVMESVGFILPKDGGDDDVARALGLTEEELAHLDAEIEASKRERRPPMLHAPFSRPEDCLAWVNPEAGDIAGIGQPAVPPGRSFEMVPRVLKCADDSRAVVHFHSSDNPFGNPLEVYRLIKSKSTAYKRERFYGIANKTVAGKFPEFGDVHIVPDASVPKKRTNRMLMDPAGGRAFFMLWIAATPEGHFVYREWPGNYEIPGIGVPGPWALPGGGIIAGRRRYDGKPGPGQKDPGWGYVQYKLEIARLERWAQFGKQPPEGMNQRDWNIAINAEAGTSEMVLERIIDSRPASTQKMENDRKTTVLTNFEEIGLIFRPAPGDDIDEGVIDINNALAWDTEKPYSEINRPKLFVCASCTNLIFALRKWTGADGLKGATKDPIDLLRYYFRDGSEYIDPRMLQSEGGGSY